MNYKGIDISNWQSDFKDFSQLKDAGIAFAICKLSEGQSMDKAFDQHYAGLRAQSIPVGAYVFSHATSISKAVAEADYAIQCLNGRGLELPIFLDLESSDINFGWNVSILPIALAFGEATRKAGYKWGIYANRSWWQNKLDAEAVRAAGGTVWCAEYGVEACKIDCDIWQYADNGTVPGYKSKVDMNIMYTTSLLANGELANVPAVENGSQDTEPEQNTTESKPEEEVGGCTIKLPILSNGTTGGYVVAAQTLLIKRGCSVGWYGADGVFGAATLSAVKKFQAQKAIAVDGIIGGDTWSALLRG